MNLYVLDTNFFIQAHRAHYPLDIATGFWDLVKNLATNEKIISIDKVFDEISRNEDVLKEWVESELPDAFFKDSELQEVINIYAQIAEWAESRSNHFNRPAISEFLEDTNADAWLVAFCKANNYSLVTQEMSDPASKKRIKIPDVCNQFDVPTCDMMKMFRELNVQF